MYCRAPLPTGSLRTRTHSLQREKMAHSTSSSLLADGQTLFDFLRMSDEPDLVPADAILVLGSNDVRVAHRAAELYALGLAPLVVFSGARGAFTESLESTEAEWLAAAARERGVPDGCILCEPSATNTGENIRFSRTLLAAHYGSEELADSKRYIVVQKPFMLRRSWATFKRQWPGGPHFQVAAPTHAKLEDYVDASIGMPLELIIEAMVGDTQRLLFYAAVKDFQVEVTVPDVVWAALGRLVGLGYTRHLCSR